MGNERSSEFALFERAGQLLSECSDDAARELGEILAVLRVRMRTMRTDSRELARAQATAVVNSGVTLAELRRAKLDAELARRDAEVANETKSEFLANISHDIRTPMNAIIGLTELALEGDLSDEPREYLSLVQGAANELLHLINDLLDLSKIEAGRMQLETVGFDLRVLTEEVSALFAVQARERSVDLRLRFRPGTPRHLVGDSGRLRQVVANLVNNAVKFTHDGRVLVDVSGRAVGDGVADVTIAVADTGIGIAPDKIDDLFRPFTQADASTTRRYGGTGLGLAICRELVNLMDGDLDVTSEPGEGSTFTVRLRLAVDQRVSPSDRRLDGRRALVADPDPERGAILAEDLASRGIDVRHVVATSPAALRRAWAEMAEHSASFVSVELLRGFRGEEVPDSHLVIVGPLGERQSVVDLCADGRRQYLTRPTRDADVRRVLAQWRSGANDYAADADPVTFDGLRVLVVEDNEVNQLVARRIMEKLGMVVDVVSQGRDAVETAARSTYDIVFMDCQMPDMDGYEATRAIRGLDGAHGAVPIVALTAHDMGDERERCLAAGMNEFLNKPLRRSPLVDALDRLLDADSRRAA